MWGKDLAEKANILRYFAHLEFDVAQRNQRAAAPSAAEGEKRAEPGREAGGCLDPSVPTAEHVCDVETRGRPRVRQGQTHGPGGEQVPRVPSGGAALRLRKLQNICSPWLDAAELFCFSFAPAVDGGSRPVLERGGGTRCVDSGG